MLFITAATILSALVQVIMAQTLKINTLASVVQCEPVMFTWEGGAPPYYLSLVPGGQPQAQALEQFPVQNGNSFTWLVNLPAGTTITSTLRDSTGAQAFSDIQTVQAGPDSGCVGNTPSSVPTPADTMMSTASSAASINTATTAPATSTSQRGTSTTTSGSGSGSATAIRVTTSAPTSTSSSNAGSLQASAGAIGIAGLLGLAGAALLG
ncbi:hypothetical protein C8Q76DRAFT_740630 [Earliella scabrosa]|nr:hypothetical protein C8Q76DRAFT_740630 [Earliella scabrosa]